MKTFIIIMVLLAIFCAVLCYMCILVAADADERAEEMAQKFESENLKK